MKQYKEVNGLHFDTRTPDKVCEILSQYSRMRSIGSDSRLRVWYGDTDTGRCWNEEHDVTGYVGRSTGSIKVPLLLHNSRSSGGTAILDSCIVRITARNHYTGRIDVLYTHPDFNLPDITIEGTSVLFDGTTQANFSTEEQAHRYAAFMSGERMSR